MYFSFNFLISLNTDIFSLMYGEGFSCPIPFICLFNLKIDSSWAMAIKLDFIISRQSLKKYYHIYQLIFCMVRRTHYNNSNTAGFAKCNFSCLIDCKYMYTYIDLHPAWKYFIHSTLSAESCKILAFAPTLMASEQKGIITVSHLLKVEYCASVPSPQFEFLPYTFYVAVRSDSLRNEFHIYFK